MGTAVADRVERPLTLFDELAAPAAPAEPAVPAAAPGRDPATATDDAAATGPERASADAPAPAEAPVADAPAAGVAAAGRTADAAGRARGGVSGESTLDELIVGAWEGLAAHAAAACPVCDGELRPRYADPGGMSPPASGACGSCGAVLS